MEEVDKEFAAIRKSVHKVDVNEIIDDVKLDGKIKKIPLQTKVKRPYQSVDLEPVMDNERVAKLSRKGSISETSPDIKIPIFSTKEKTQSTEYKELQEYLIKKIHGTLDHQDIVIPDFLRGTSFELERLLEQCIIQKESHSAVIIGPRSKYKTLLIQNHLDALTKTHNEQFIVIKLNGFIHSENSAINSIAEQLEFELSRRGNSTSLSTHKIEQTGISDGTPTEVFENILKLLDSFTVTPLKGVPSHKDRSDHISLVFVFDEIDKFAGPIRQTLLYNLFDLVENSRIPVCVLGLTTKLGVLQFLENRVKSRFSQRIIYMPTISNFDAFKRTFLQLLTAEKPGISKMSKWNQLLKHFLSTDDSEISRILRKNYETFKDITLLQNAMVPAIALSKTYDALEEEIETCRTMKKYISNQLLDSWSAKIESLSELELAILISACRVALKKDEFINLTLVHEEFNNMGKSHITTFADKFKMWSKDDLKNVWENLAEQELITERGTISVKFTEDSAIQSANYNSSTMKAPYDLRTFQVYVTLQELRKLVPKNSFFHSWTQL